MFIITIIIITAIFVTVSAEQWLNCGSVRHFVKYSNPPSAAKLSGSSVQPFFEQIKKHTDQLLSFVCLCHTVDDILKKEMSASF